MSTEAQLSPGVEADLVCRAQAGDTGAFDALVRMYARRAVSLAYRVVHEGQDAQDVAQEAFLRAFRNLSQLDDPARFGTWMMRVVWTQALNFKRAQKRRLSVSFDEVVEATSQVRNPATGQPLMTALEDSEGPLPDAMRKALTAAIEKLPEQERLSLILHKVEGLPQKQVAEILDISVEMVKWNVFQAKKKLRDLLQGDVATYLRHSEGDETEKE